MSEDAYRNELKFVCAERQLQLIENKIKHICRKDPHVDSDGIYHIKSLYFDTYDDKFFFESLSGVNQRYKYRIRTYNDSEDMIKLERKSSVNGLKRKETCEITKNQCGQLLENLSQMEVGAEQWLLKEFMAERMYALLKPCIIVDYVRTPYVYPIGNVRITFDRNIAFSGNIDFFNRELPRRAVMPEGIHILEVKYDGLLPRGILDLINYGFGIKRESFSKYVLCRRADIGGLA